MKISRVISSLWTLSFLWNVHAQTQDLAPKSWSAKIPLATTVLEMPPVNNAQALQAALEKQEAGFDKMLRFGEELTVDRPFRKMAEVFHFPNGSQLSRAVVWSPGAHSINLIFSNFHLAQGATLHLVNQKTGKYLGAYTAANNNEAKVLGTELLAGDEVTIELYEPKEVVGKSTLNLQTVVHAFRSLNDLAIESLNSSGDCNVDVNCPEGNGWELQRNSVAMMVNGGGFCTGSLVHNTSGNIIPYFLTARHCGTNPSNWVFRFRWESPDSDTSCASVNPSGNGPENMNVNGASFCAMNGTSDFLLVKLNAAPNPSWGIFYNGWDNSDLSTVPSGVGIHHPDGDIKKIAVENAALSQETIQFNGSQNRTWKVSDWDAGVTEPGSSGSPLFDSNKRVIGVLSGGNAACSGVNDNGQPDYYGRFGYAWDNGADSTERLKEWLDPANTGVSTLDGVDPALGNVARDASISNLTGFDGPTCEETVNMSFSLFNAGTDNIVAVQYRYGSNGNWTTDAYAGNLASNSSVQISHTVPKLTGQNNFEVEVLSVNGQSDQNPNNDVISKPYFNMSHDSDLSLHLQLDCYGSETSWEITTDQDVVIYGDGPYVDVDNPPAIDTLFCIQVGCYKFKIYDSFGDGMTGCNQNQGGDGSYVLSDNISQAIYAELEEAEADFGTQNVQSFCVDFVGLKEENSGTNVRLFPNPGTENFALHWNEKEESAEATVLTVDGKVMAKKTLYQNNNSVHTSGWPAGVYLVKVKIGEEQSTLRWVKR